MASKGSKCGPPTPTKSKQERIRDNQRRSRARRQEYLADLEGRLKECHVACREAELQRAAFAELQAENARLRNLLNNTGVTPDVVEGFGHQHLSSQSGQATNVVLRQIKPKFQTPIIAENPDALIIQGPNSGSCCSPTTSFSSTCAPTPAFPMHTRTVYSGQHPTPFMSASAVDAMGFPVTTDVPIVPSYEWMHGFDEKASTDLSFCCDTFLVPPTGPLLADNGNTVQCSVAKTMIDQYHPTPAEMEEIKVRLATAFSPPSLPEPGCRVDIQPLWQILREMNSTGVNG